MVCLSNKDLLNKIPHSGLFGRPSRKLRKVPVCGWVHYFYSLVQEEEDGVNCVHLSWAESGVLHGLFAPWSQNFPEGKPSCNDKRLGWDSPDREAQCFWDYCIVSILPYIHTNPLHPFLFVDCKHSVCNFFHLV